MSDFNYQDYLRNNPLLQKEVTEDKLITEAKDKDIEESAPGFKHDCAAHVMHESHGYGLCLEGRHTLVETTDGHAEVTHYDVMFKSGEIVEKIPVNELKILTSESHSHSKYEEDDVEEVMGVDRKGNKKPDVEMSKAAKAKADAKNMKEEEVTENLNPAEQQKVMGALNNYVAEFKPDFGKVEEIADMLSELTGISSNKIQSYLMQLTGGDDEMRFNEEIEEAEIELSQDEMDDLHKDGEVKKGADTIKFKMKVSELKAKIREDIIDVLSEQEDEIDVEDEIEMDVDAEEPKMDAANAQDGLTQDEKEIQDSLKIAYDNAVAMGDQKLADQIGNSITFFTRTHVVER